MQQMISLYTTHDTFYENENNSADRAQLYALFIFAQLQIHVGL